MARIRWVRCVLAGVIAFAASTLVIAIVVLGYAFVLAFEARGAPDQAKIGAFVRELTPVWGPILRVALTFVAGFVVSRRAGARLLQGLVVGATSGLAGLAFTWPPTAWAVLVFALAVAAGAAGGFLASRLASASSQRQSTGGA